MPYVLPRNFEKIRVPTNMACFYENRIDNDHRDSLPGIRARHLLGQELELI